jgi:hypothetical protein
MTTLKIPLGRAKGQLITECSTRDLEWALGIIEKRLCEGKAYDFKESDERWAPEAARVLKARLAAGDTVAHAGVVAAPSSAAAPLTVVRPPSEVLATVTQTLRDAKAATALLAQAKELGHLVSPAPSVGFLPEGCFVSVSALLVDPVRETYQQAGSSERGISKVALDKIGGAAGIDWDPVLSTRLDNRSHAWYCHCKAVGRVRRFDGTWRTLSDEFELDLTDGSGEVEAILAREKRKEKDEGTRYRGDLGRTEIAQKRKFILRLATTGARLRATRQLGLRTAYNAEELAKPFIMAQLSFDGYSEDAETRRLFASRIADNFLGASARLYGEPPLLQRAEPRVIDLPSDEEEPEFGPPDYGFVDLPKTGTGGPY